MIQYKQMSNIKTYNSILAKLVIIFPIILIVSLYSNDKAGNITPLKNFLDTLLLPSLIGTILSAVLLKITNKKLDKGSSTISKIALIIALIAVGIIIFWVSVFYQWQQPENPNMRPTQGQGY
jgi:mannose/fructose/N-acetylgalactosamine-specific phosphotransferase system component IID